MLGSRLPCGIVSIPGERSVWQTGESAGRHAKDEVPGPEYMWRAEGD